MIPENICGWKFYANWDVFVTELQE